MFPIELVIDEVARALRRDPLDVRIANLYGTTTRNLTPYGMAVEDNVAPEIIAQLEVSARYRQRRRAIAQWNHDNPVIKRGIALTPVKFGISFTATHYNQAGALLHLYNDGTLLLNHGGTEMGQGLFTKVAQVVAQELGVPLATVRVSASDTSKVPNASPTAASSGSDINGMAARNAARTLRERLVAFRRAPFRLRSGDRRVRRRYRDRGNEDTGVRGAGAHGLHGTGAAVRDRLLRDAQDPLRSQDADRATVFLFRVRRRRLGSGDRHAHRRAPAACRGHPA
jgi:xanthine dehydrogenase large subunit